MAQYLTVAHYSNTAIKVSLLALSGVFTYFFYISLLSPYVYGDYLLLDDTFFLSRTALGQTLVPSTHPLTFYFMRLFSGQPVEYVKIANIVFIGLLSSLLAIFLYFQTQPRHSISSPVETDFALILASSITITCFLAWLDQGLFVTGSHPIAGILLTLLGLCFLVWARRRSSVLLFVISGLACTLLFCMARLASPSFFLVPILAPVAVFLLATPDYNKQYKFVMTAICGAMALAFVVASGFSYSYSELPGWTSYSFGPMIYKLGPSLLFIAKPVFQSYVLLAFIVALAALSLPILKQLKKETSTLKLTLLLLLLAIATFAPGAVVVEHRPRYLAAPFFFTSVALLVVLLPNAKPLTYFYERAYSGLAILISILLLYVTHATSLTRITDWNKDTYPSFIAFSAVIAKERASWKPSAQVAFILPSNGRSPTSGAHHWSTWYLRYLSGRHDLIGLVGSASQISPNPFVEKYSDYGLAVFQDQGGKAMARRMLGFERDRPTYVYNLKTLLDRPCPSLVNFSLPNEAPVKVGPGQTFLEGKANASAAFPNCSAMMNWQPQ